MESNEWVAMPYITVPTTKTITGMVPYKKGFLVFTEGEVFKVRRTRWYERLWRWINERING